jgi:hypothetical protein
LSEPVDFEPGKVDLLLQVCQELANPVAFLDGSGQGVLELYAEFMLLFRRNQFRGFDQAGEIILDYIEPVPF